MCELLYLQGVGRYKLVVTFLKNAKKSLRSGQKCPKPGGIRIFGSKWAYGVVFLTSGGTFLIYCLLHVF